MESRLEKLINQSSEVFEEGLGTFRGPKAKIHVEVDAVPNFCKAQPVPYAMKGEIEEELKGLQEEGTIESVQFSEWAAPIVPIMKHNNSIRICGDYKTTVNQVSKLDNYPILCMSKGSCLHTCQACVIATWILGLRSPLVTHNY